MDRVRGNAPLSTQVADLLLRMYKDPSSGASKALLHSSGEAASGYCGSLADALLTLSSGECEAVRLKAWTQGVALGEDRWCEGAYVWD